MIYVQIEGVKSEGRGSATGNGWFETEIGCGAGTERFHTTYEALGHGAVVTYHITVAPEASPRRTLNPGRWPLPVGHGEGNGAT